MNQKFGIQNFFVLENFIFNAIGNCSVVGDCVSSTNYPDGYGDLEYCNIYFMRDSEVFVEDYFRIETCCDHLLINDLKIDTQDDIPSRLREGSIVIFSTDASSPALERVSVTQGGWQMCFSASSSKN